MATLRFLGHSSWEVTTQDGTVIYVDPWLVGNPVAPITLDEVQKADLVCVTHGHLDHIGNSIEIAKKTGATLVCAPDMGYYFELHHNLRWDKETYPLHEGGSATVRGIGVHMTHAQHSAEIYGPEWTTDQKYFLGAGTVIGYVLDLEPGVSLYHPGDTGLFSDMQLIAELYHPNIGVLPIGGRYTMGPREAAIATGWLRLEAVIPMHYDTFPDQAQDDQEFARQVTVRSPETKTVILKPGEIYEYRGS